MRMASRSALASPKRLAWTAWGIAGEGGLAQHGDAVPVEDGLVVLQDRAAEGVVLVDDAEAALAALPEDVVHQHPGLVEVARPQVDDVRKAPGVAQEVGSREGTDEGDLRRPQHRRDALGRGRPHAADHGQDLVLFGEPLGVAGGQLGLVGVVQGDQLQRPPVDPSPGVALVEGGLQARPVVQAQALVGPGEAGALAEEDRPPGTRRRQVRRQQQQARHAQDGGPQAHVNRSAHGAIPSLPRPRPRPSPRSSASPPPAA